MGSILRDQWPRQGQILMGLGKRVHGELRQWSQVSKLATTEPAEGRPARGTTHDPRGWLIHSCTLHTSMGCLLGTQKWTGRMKPQWWRLCSKEGETNSIVVRSAEHKEKRKGAGGGKVGFCFLVLHRCPRKEEPSEDVSSPTPVFCVPGKCPPQGQTLPREPAEQREGGEEVPRRPRW